jgi:hypothetical protein
MKLGNFVKTPDERKRYAIDYSEWLDTDELVDSYTFAVAPSETGGLEVDASSLSTDETTIVFFVNDGNDGTQYTVTATTTTTGGQVKQDTILFQVRAD